MSPVSSISTFLSPKASNTSPAKRVVQTTKFFGCLPLGTQGTPWEGTLGSPRDTMGGDPWEPKGPHGREPLGAQGIPWEGTLGSPGTTEAQFEVS